MTVFVLWGDDLIFSHRAVSLLNNSCKFTWNNEKYFRDFGETWGKGRDMCEAKIVSHVEMGQELVGSPHIHTQVTEAVMVHW